MLSGGDERGVGVVVQVAVGVVRVAAAVNAIGGGVHGDRIGGRGVVGLRLGEAVAVAVVGPIQPPLDVVWGAVGEGRGNAAQSSIRVTDGAAAGPSIGDALG